MAVVIESKGYAGDVDEPAWADYGGRMGARYSVDAPEHLRVTAVAGADRTVRIALGRVWGAGIRDTLSGDTPTVQLPIPSGPTGTIAWYVIVLRRTWTGTGGTTVPTWIAAASVNGLPGRVPATRAKVKGQLDEQPLAIVRVTVGQSTPIIEQDLRVWSTNGGMVALSDRVLDFLDEPGTVVHIGDNVHRLVPGEAGGVTPIRHNMQASPLLATTTTTMVGGTPGAMDDFYEQDGYTVVVPNGSGDATITYPVAFPNGVVRVTPALATGVGGTNPGPAILSLYSPSSAAVGRPTRTAFSFRVFNPATGAPITTAVGVPWTARGW